MRVLADVRYQVFISSTYDDLRLERQQATQAILEMNHMPAGMELFPASDTSQWELIKTVINESDYYVVIVGGRYGTVSRETGLSFTEMEYDYAASSSVPILGFVRRDISDIAARDSESDPSNRRKLESFRSKVLGRICRLYDEPVELGMLVMKSMINEIRTTPRTGWVRADQARGQEDIVREQSLLQDLKQRDRIIKKLEREIRDRSVKLAGISPEQLAQGRDRYSLDVMFLTAEKQASSASVSMSWDEILSVIGPTMYGYILRRGPPAHGKLVGQYTFEGSLIAYLRTKLFAQCGTRQLTLLPHQVDTILIQLKQLGLVELTEKTLEQDGENFRGYALTSAGEERLTRLKVQLQSA